MQGDEIIGVVPVTTRLTVPVDEGDPRVAFGQQGVGEGQAHGPRAHDQIVGLDFRRSRHPVLPPAASAAHQA